MLVAYVVVRSEWSIGNILILSILELLFIFTSIVSMIGKSPLLFLCFWVLGAIGLILATVKEVIHLYFKSYEMYLHVFEVAVPIFICLSLISLFASAFKHGKEDDVRGLKWALTYRALPAILVMIAMSLYIRFNRSRY